MPNTTPKHSTSGCATCAEHSIWEERLKVLDKIPALMTWMNITKGVMLVIGILIGLLFSSVNDSKKDMLERQEKHEIALKEKSEVASNRNNIIAAQVQSISRDTGDIKTSVALMNQMFNMYKEEGDRIRKENKEILTQLRRDINTIKSER